MTTGSIAQVVEELYYAGRVMANDTRLEYEDFLQLVIIANASVLHDRFKENELLAQDSGISDLLVEHELAITEDKYRRKVSPLPGEVVSLPNDAGVFAVTPLAGDGSLLQCKPIIRMPAGSEWLYCNDIDEPFAYFTRYKNQLVFYSLEDCVKKVLVSVVTTSEDAPIPDDIGWDVFKQVYTQVARTIAIPIDKRMDGDPNLEEIFRTKLASPQLNR